MKLLFAVSSLDLRQPYSSTPSWWQLLKGLYEIGVEVIATPYQGPAIESLWWRAEPNPAKFHGDAFNAARNLVRRVARGNSKAGSAKETRESFSDKLVRQTARSLIAPVWGRHLDRILRGHPDVDAVIFLTIPLNHVSGVAADIQKQHGKPVFYYDGDLPASLPTMRGFATGFRIYQGADLSEYTAFIGNSAGASGPLRELGARAVHTLFYGVDPDVFSPMDRQEDIDVLFYGHGREYRSKWIDEMITGPSQSLRGARFAVRGTNLGSLGRAELLPYLGFSKMREYVSRSRINLCITRLAHASVFASSSARPFELASMGACMVANPYLGIEEWFEPGTEILVVNTEEEAVERYRHLLAHEPERRTIGRAARERVLKQHTARHRARQLTEIVQGYL